MTSSNLEGNPTQQSNLVQESEMQAHELQPVVSATHVKASPVCSADVAGCSIRLCAGGCNWVLHGGCPGHCSLTVRQSPCCRRVLRTATV